MIEGMVAGAVMLLVLAGLRAWLVHWWCNRASVRRERRLAQELAEFADHPTFKWDAHERR